jgi:surface antigen
MAGATKGTAMRKLFALAAVLVLAGCTYYYYPAAAPRSAQAAAQSAASADCREFTETVTIDGQPRQLTGRACPQPDGTWRLQ